jgi:hypothetical protein
MEDTILDALASRKILTFIYGGFPRTCEPHVLGTANRKTQVLCYQIDGGSSRGGLPQWRRFDLGGISDLKTTNETFDGARPLPKGPHSIWDNVIKVVE